MPRNSTTNEADSLESRRGAAALPPPVGWRRFGRSERILIAVAAGGLICLYGVAWLLSPDPRGLGTHEQLGLAPCMTQWLFDVPCPFCGMTTAFVEMAHGHPLRSFVTQPAGAVIALICAAGVLVCGAAAIVGRYPEAAVRRAQSKGTFIALAVVILFAWIYKIGEHALR